MTKDPELYETEAGNKVTTITVAVPRTFKNSDGVYEADFVRCSIWRGIAENVCEFCHKGDLIGIKGHIQTRDVVIDEVQKCIMEVVADKVTFLTSKNQFKEAE